MKTHKHLVKKTFLLLSGLLLLALLTQCTGPRGPRGYDGANGLDGTDGADGVDGDVYAYSTIYDVEVTEWTGNADGYIASLNVPEITDDIYYNGAVLVYRLIEVEPKSFNMLPYTWVDGDLTIYMDYDAFIGGIDVIYKEIYQDVNDTFAPEALMSFKVLIIEGIPLAQLKTMVDISNYEAVTKVLSPKLMNDKPGYIPLSN